MPSRRTLPVPASAVRLIALLGLLSGACRRASATGPVRFIAAPASGSTAALARAEIAGESRYVLAAHPPVVRIDASVLVREQAVGAAAPTLAELDAARMVTASAPPLVVRGRDEIGRAHV